MPRLKKAFLISLLLLATISCKQESTTTTTDTSGTDTSATSASLTGSPQVAPAGMTTVQVTLRFSGAAHLVDDVTPPFLVVPNFTKIDSTLGPPHQALLLAVDK